MSNRTEQVYANEINVGDVIVCPNGDSVTVEKIEREGDLIDFSGQQTTYSSFGNTDVGVGYYNQFWDELVTILSRGGK